MSMRRYIFAVQTGIRAYTLTALIYVRIQHCIITLHIVVISSANGGMGAAVNRYENMNAQQMHGNVFFPISTHKIRATSKHNSMRQSRMPLTSCMHVKWWTMGGRGLWQRANENKRFRVRRANEIARMHWVCVTLNSFNAVRCTVCYV